MTDDDLSNPWWEQPRTPTAPPPASAADDAPQHADEWPTDDRPAADSGTDDDPLDTRAQNHGTTSGDWSKDSGQPGITLDDRTGTTSDDRPTSGRPAADSGTADDPLSAGTRGYGLPGSAASESGAWGEGPLGSGARRSRAGGSSLDDGALGGGARRYGAESSGAVDDDGSGLDARGSGAVSAGGLGGWSGDDRRTGGASDAWGAGWLEGGGEEGLGRSGRFAGGVWAGSVLDAGGDEESEASKAGRDAVGRADDVEGAAGAGVAAGVGVGAEGEVARVGVGPWRRGGGDGDGAGVPRARRREGRAVGGDSWGKRVDRVVGVVLEVATAVAGNRYGVAALILVGVAALAGAAALSRPGAVAGHQGEAVVVEAALLACPAAEQGARFGAASAGKGEGGASVSALDGKADGKPLAAFEQTGVWTGTLKKGTAVAVRAQGGAAAGLEAAHTVVGKRGVESAPCTAPGTEHWFVTPGPGDGPLDLHVTNVDDAPASVDLEAISDDGSLDTTDGKALEIPPRSTRVIGIGETLDGLGPIASDARVMALRVTATSGRVAAAVHADAGRRGLDWATAAAPPARHVIVPGVPGGSGTRTLFVGTPSRDDARVEIRVITADGVFAPEGQGLLDVPAGTVIPVDLEAALGGKPAAVELRSTKPLVAGLAAGGYDLGLGASAVPLDGGTTAVGALPAAGATRVKAAARETASVVLTAPERDAVVEITPLVPGQGAPAEVRIPAGRTVEVPFTATAVRIVPKAGSGPVYGARVLTVKAGQRRDHRTVRTLVPAPLEIRLPPVSDSLTSVIP